MIVNVELASLFLTEFFEGVSPEDIAHEAVSGRFSESIDLQSQHKHRKSELTYTLDVLQGVELRAQSTVYAKKLFIHDSG